MRDVAHPHENLEFADLLTYELDINAMSRDAGADEEMETVDISTLHLRNTSTQAQADRAEAINHPSRGEGLGSRPKKMYGERLGDGVEYHLMSPTPRR